MCHVMYMHVSGMSVYTPPIQYNSLVHMSGQHLDSVTTVYWGVADHRKKRLNNMFR